MRSGGFIQAICSVGKLKVWHRTPVIRELSNNYFGGLLEDFGGGRENADRFVAIKKEMIFCFSLGWE